MVTHPTVVVGAGQAGINVMSKIHEVTEEEGDEEMFKYIAVDTDKDTLNNAPTGAITVTLSLDDDFLKDDVGQYPFLTKNMKIRGSGAKRQRPVGRYKLDRRGDGGFEDVFSRLDQEIEAHYDDHKVKLGQDTASFNVFFIHSFGGGTGSGSYPLVLSMLHRIARQRLDAVDEVVYMGGVGVVPEITFSPDVDDPAGNPNYYPNAYAAFSDLKEFTDIYSGDRNGDDGPLELPIWSRTISRSGGASLDGTDFSDFEFYNVPFDDYWLVGVDEGKLEGTSAGHAGPESYREELNQTMARSIHSISKLDQSAENWANATSFTGTFDQAEVSVPHDDVVALVETREDREEKTERINVGIPDEIAGLEDRIGELEDLKSELDEDQVDDEELKREIQTYLDNEEFRGGAYIVDNKTADDVEAAFDTIESEYRIEALIVATDDLRDRLREERGAPAVEEEWQDTIQSLWDRYDLQGKSEYGASGVRTLEGKAGVLEEYLNDQIDEFVEIKEEWDPSVIERIQDLAPPVIGALESDREYAERWLAALQDDYNELERVMGTWDRVNRMLEAIESRRREVRGMIDDRIDDLNGQITDLQNERDRLREAVRRLDRDIEGLEDSLTTEQTSERLAVLPLEAEKLDDIDRVVLENDLTSLLSYVEEGYVAEENLRYALNQRLDFVEAWNADIIDREMAGTDEERRFDDINEIWYLYHEANENFTDYITDRPDASELFSGEKDQSRLQYLEDPHRIKYIAYTRRGPVSALTTYQQYERLDGDGWLQQYANQYEHYLQAFAYLEWYGSDVEEAFKVRRRIPVPRPPELSPERVDKPGLDEGELKNYIVTNGLDSYLWNGNMWDAYEIGGERFRGWKTKLTPHGITFTDLQRATPDSRLKSEWLADQRDWEDVLEAYRDNLYRNHDTKLVHGEE